MIENTLQNANGMEGKINIMGYFVVPFYTGELKENGSFQITLPNHFDQVTGRAFEAYNASPIADYELHYSTALESFPDADGLSFKEKGLVSLLLVSTIDLKYQEQIQAPISTLLLVRIF